MSEKLEVSAIGAHFDSTAALARVTALTGTSDGVVERRMLYPYYHYRANARVPTLAGKKQLAVDCLVDAVNGSGLTADPFRRESLDVSPACVLARGIGQDAAARVAHRTVTHRLGKKFRIIAPFDVELEYSGIVHRGFWIVRVGRGRVMVDSATGAVQSLGADAA